MRNARHYLLAASLVAMPVARAAAVDFVGVGLRGSRASMRRQHERARELDLTFLRTASQVREFAGKDRLERLTGNENYSIGRVSFPYARVSVRLFIERLSAQYRAATGEVLVITSLTRPTSMQPRNASPLSVHPTGIAVDLRIPTNRNSRAWLEKTLLSLERTGVLDATRERRPPHYHVAVFPEEYEEYVGTVAGAVTTSAALMLAGVQSTMSIVPGVTSIPAVQSGPSLEPATPSATLETVAFAFVIIGLVALVGGATSARKARLYPVPASGSSAGRLPERRAVGTTVDLRQ